MVQASIFDCAKIQEHQQQMSDAANSLDVPSTLYLGEEDLLRLKETLEDARSGHETLMTVLRRLSTVPCTRRSLESTRIGVAVGHLRRSSDVEVADLAARIVTVWKRQVKEERAQQQQQHHQNRAPQHYSGDGRRRG